MDTNNLAFVLAIEKDRYEWAEFLKSAANQRSNTVMNIGRNPANVDKVRGLVFPPFIPERCCSADGCFPPIITVRFIWKL